MKKTDEIPKINVELEKPLYDKIGHLAKKDGVSLSMAVCGLVKEALEIREDTALAGIAEAREKSFRRKP